MNKKYYVIIVLAVVMFVSLAISGCTSREYFVNFDANGGVGESTIQTLTVGIETQLQTNTFYKENYTFCGWSTDKDATTPIFIDKQNVTDIADVGQTITLYAVWMSKQYIVNFDANGGKGEMPSQQIEVNQSVNLTQNVFTNSGYSFIGWALDKNSKTVDYTDGQKVTNLAQSNASVTLYAVWQKLVYTIQYDGNGATSGEMYNQNVACGKQTALTENTFSRGYKYDFLGWSTDKNATTPIYTDQQIITDIADVEQTITLYAVWADWVVPSRQPQSATALVVENANDKGNSDLQGDWTVEKYENSWVNAIATIQVVGSYDNTNGIKLSYWDNYVDYRYSKGYSTTSDYDTITLDLKGNGISQVRITLANSNYGVYMTYQLGIAPAVWTRYEISIFDDNWTIDYGGKNISIEEGIKLMNLTGYYDVIKWFDTFRISVKGSTTNGANAYAYLDNIAFEQTESTETISSSILFDFGGTYTAKLNNGTVVKAIFDTASVRFETINLQQNITFVTDYQKQDDYVAFSGTVSGNATISGNGEKFKIDVLDKVNPLLNGAEFSKVYQIDNFENYSQKGVGLDSANVDISNTSGLRGSYYAEYYVNDESITAPIGGKKWSLMNDSVNYIDISATAHGGNQSMQLVSLKNGNARYISMSVASGGASVIGKGSTLGFWVKNVSNGEIKIRQAYVIYRDTVNINNITNTTTTSFGLSKSFTIPANSNWVFCEVPVDSTKDIYGVVIVLLENYSADRYLLVDDITLYATSPYESYVDSSSSQMPEYANVNLDFQSLTGEEYNGTDWKQENLQGSNWAEIGGQMRIRQNVTNNNVLNMYTYKDNCYRYTYVGDGNGLGKANYFSIDLGNYYQTPSDVKIKIMLVDSESNVHYLLGTVDEYFVLSSTKGTNGEQNLVTYEYNFDQIAVVRFVIEIKGTNGNQYVYMDNVKLANI